MDEPLYHVALRMMESHQFGVEGVQAEISRCIGPAFWSTLEPISKPGGARPHQQLARVSLPRTDSVCLGCGAARKSSAFRRFFFFGLLVFFGLFWSFV